MKEIDLTGQRFSRLVVLRREPIGSRRAWLCACDCGRSVFASTGNLKRGSYKSCGCLRSELVAERARKLGLAKRTHGMSKTSIFSVWSGIIQRCTNPNLEHFKDYGGRGIKFDPRWSDFQNFFDDIKVLGWPSPPGTSLDRKDNNGDYVLSNLRWSTQTEQTKNRRKFCSIENYTDVELLLECQRRGLA